MSVEPFGTVLRRCRVTTGLSQEELAERAGLSVRGIGDLERGLRTAPRIRTIQVLAHALGLSDAARRELMIAARPELADASLEQHSTTLAPTRDPLHLPPQARVPVPPTRLIGRDQDVETTVALLRREQVRLVTLTGAGGVGKTQLAIATARDVESDFADGVAFVDLASVRQPGMVASQIARTLGITDTSAAPVMTSLLALLGDRQLLLVLDNCEHVLPALPLAASLLGASPGLKVLATSRERLHLRGEREYAVNPLSLPDSPVSPPLEMLASAAIQLFVERAEEADSRFVLTKELSTTVAAICARLDGLPLAIELVAARLRYLSAPTLLARLEQHTPLHEVGPRDLPERQRTLSATIAWSHDLLSPAEQAIFRRISVFAGGFDAAAAEAVAGSCQVTSGLDDGPPEDPVSAMFARLASLMDKSLLLHASDDHGAARFTMLETIREDAASRLTASGEEESTRRSHAAHVLAMSRRAAMELGGPEQQRWLDRLDVEHDNVRAVLAWAASGHDVETGLFLARALARFWHIRGYAAEGREWFERLLEAACEIPTDVRAWPTYYAGLMAWAQGDLGAAHGWFTDSLELFQEVDDRKGIATAVGMLGAVAEHNGDLERATVLNEQSLGLYRELGNSPGVATMVDALGNIAVDQGDHNRAAAHFEEALALYHELDDLSGIARVLSNIGVLALVQGDIATAERTSGESLSLHAQVGYHEGVAYALENLARAAKAKGEPERSARLFGAAEGLRSKIGTPIPASALEAHLRDVEAVRRQLGEDAFSHAWTSGRSLPLDRAIAEAHAGVQTTERQ